MNWIKKIFGKPSPRIGSVWVDTGYLDSCEEVWDIGIHVRGGPDQNQFCPLLKEKYTYEQAIDLAQSFMDLTEEEALIVRNNFFTKTYSSE